MMHKQRQWSVSEVESAADLSEMLTQRTWTLCSGFYVHGHPDYLFLNDSTHEDGAGEFAICKRGVAETDFVQVESITFLWLNGPEALTFINEALAGRLDDSDFASEMDLKAQTPETHGRCPLCA